MKLVEMKVNEFVDLMASDEPAPGGGSAATPRGLVSLWAPFGRPPCGTRKELRAARLLVLSDHYGCPPFSHF